MKSKRWVLKSLNDRIRGKFNVSVACADNLDKWQRQTIAVACINKDKRLVDSCLQQIINLVDNQHEVELLDHTIEIY